MNEIRKCCGHDPEVFHDTKVGRRETRIVITCGYCGRYVDGLVMDDVIKGWNESTPKKHQKI